MKHGASAPYVHCNFRQQQSSNDSSNVYNSAIHYCNTSSLRKENKSAALHALSMKPDESGFFEMKDGCLKGLNAGERWLLPKMRLHSSKGKSLSPKTRTELLLLLDIMNHTYTTLQLLAIYWKVLKSV